MGLDNRIVLLAGVVIIALAVGTAGATSQGADQTSDVCKILPTDYSLSDHTVSVGESIQITVTVENTCDREETTDVVPMKDGNHVKSKTKTVSVPAKSTITTTIEVSFSTAGDHTVSIFDLDSTPVTVTEKDSDGDGVPDGEDGCPETAEDEDGVQDGDGCPEEDADGDGVPDGEDGCPTEAEDEDSVQDGDGCPDETIWTQDHLTDEQKNDECLQQVLKLAQQIAMSEEAADAWRKVNKPGLDIEDELAPGEAPEINFTDLGDDLGEYRGDAGGPEGQIFVDTDLFENCGDSDEARLKLAVTILHETAHWKDDVKKHPDSNNDTDGEEGTQWEEDTFGTAYPENESADDVDHWVDPETWTDENDNATPSTQSASTAGTDASLSLSVEPTSEEYAAGETVRVEVTLTNTGSTTVDVLSSVALEGYPYYFDITDSDGDQLAFQGPEIRPDLGAEDFVSLAPGESHTETVNLGRDPVRDTPRYGGVTTPGEYTVTAVYEGHVTDVATLSSDETNVTVRSGTKENIKRFDSDNSGTIEFSEVLTAIAAFNNGETVGGENVGFQDVLAVIRAFNSGESL